MNNIRERHRQHLQYKHHRGGGDKRWFGVALLAIGSFILLRKLDIVDFNWNTMWPWVLIAIGMFIGVKNKFTNHAWWILSLIGVAHLIPPFYVLGVSARALLVPAVMIGLGAFFIFRPQRKKKSWDDRCDGNVRTVTNAESVLNIDVTLGGHKEIVTSKDFKGGNISTMFGGTELNLMNADSTEKTINLHCKVSFGSIEIVVPSHWQIKNEIRHAMGSVEDNRNVYTGTSASDTTVTLVLTGSCNFGNVEIKSY